MMMIVAAIKNLISLIILVEEIILLGREKG